MAETFYKYIGCEDCKTQFRSRCPLCKQKAHKWRDKNGRHVPLHQLTADSKSILRHTKRDYAVLFDDRIITPPPIKVKKLKVKLKNSKKEKIVPEQPLPITWENFFIATKGAFEEIEFIPNSFESFFKSKGSEYFINDEKDKLVRKSDHWGFGIRYCNWYLKGYGFTHCGSWKKNQDEPLKIGLINISELLPSFKPKKKRFQYQEFIHSEFDLSAE